MIKYEAHLAEAEIMMTVKWLLGLFPKQRKNTLWIFPSGRFSLSPATLNDKILPVFTGVRSPGSRAELKRKAVK